MVPSNPRERRTLSKPYQILPSNPCFQTPVGQQFPCEGLQELSFSCAATMPSTARVRPQQPDRAAGAREIVFRCVFATHLLFQNSSLPEAAT